jgi:hypothetical protein
MSVGRFVVLAFRRYVRALWRVAERSERQAVRDGAVLASI